MIADCCWCNYCGVCCAGWLCAFCCISCWLCQPIELGYQPCCQIGTCTGYGGNCFCYGYVCCAPDYIIRYSHMKTTAASSHVLVSDRGAVVLTQQVR
jgi:hypothetical protein